MSAKIAHIDGIRRARDEHRARQEQIARKYRQEAGLEELDQPDMSPGSEFYRCGCGCITFWTGPTLIVCTECAAEIPR